MIAVSWDGDFTTAETQVFFAKIDRHKRKGAGGGRMAALDSFFGSSTILISRAAPTLSEMQ